MNGPSLHDIILPPDPGFWPPAPGWWMLALIGSTVGVLLVRRLLRAMRRRSRRRQLVAELDASLAPSHSPAERLAALSALLRRWCIEHAPAAVALQGDDWLEALDQDLPDAPFRSALGRLLVQGPYMAEPSRDGLDELQALVRRRVLHEVPHA